MPDSVFVLSSVGSLMIKTDENSTVSSILVSFANRMSHRKLRGPFVQALLNNGNILDKDTKITDILHNSIVIINLYRVY